MAEVPTTAVAKVKGKKGKKDGEEKQQVVISYGPPNVSETDLVFAVCHLLATFNDTFLHITDLTGRETLVRVTGGMKVKADRDESSPYAAMMAVQDVVSRLKELKVNAIHIKLRGRGGFFDKHNQKIGTSIKSPGPGAQTALRAFARAGMRIGRIEDVTPVPTDSTRRSKGRRGRRL